MKKTQCHNIFIILILLVTFVTSKAQEVISAEVVSVSDKGAENDTDLGTIYVVGDTQLVVNEGAHIYGDIKKVDVPQKRTDVPRPKSSSVLRSPKPNKKTRELQRQIYKVVHQPAKAIVSLPSGTENDKYIHILTRYSGISASTTVLKHLDPAILQVYKDAGRVPDRSSGISACCYHSFSDGRVDYFSVLFARPPTAIFLT